MKLQDIASQLRCQELMLTSYQLIDDGNASRVTELFTEDGRFTITGSVDVAGREALHELFLAREADTQRHTRHCLSNLLYAAVTGSEAQIRARLLLFVLDGASPAAPSGLADVVDQYRLQRDEWRISQRTTTLLG